MLPVTTRAVCQLPYPLEAIPSDYVDEHGIKGGAFGNWASDRKALGLGPHRGVDFSGFHVDRLNLSRTIVAFVDGVVTAIRWSDVLGNTVEVLDAEGWYWLICHVKGALVHTGDRVIRGQTPLAVMGQTGSAASFDHFHIALSQTTNGGAEGVVVDPIAHIQARLPEEDDVADTTGSFSYSPDHPLALAPNAWVTVPIDDSGRDFSFITGFDGIVQLNAKLKLSGIGAGRTAQARLQIVTYTDGKATATAYSDVIELHGSDGFAFPAFSEALSVHANQRVRLVLLGQEPTAQLVRVAVSVVRLKRSAS